MKQIVISVPEEWLEGTQPNLYDVMGAVMNGTVLPEHYGRLIEDKLIADEYVRGKADPYYIITSEWLKLQPTIIPATKEGDGNMSRYNYSCANECGDEDCGKCMKRGIIFECPPDCTDYEPNFPVQYKHKSKEKEQNNG